MSFRAPFRSVVTRVPSFASFKPLQSRVFSSSRFNQQEDLQRRAVVGSFLLKRDQDGTPKVALFRRTDKVNTYQHKYATISGGIELNDSSPLDAAKRELREETTLDADALPLLCHGKHYSFIDRKANYEWSVYPFAFRLTPEAESQIQLGWEHESYKWFPADQIPAREAELAAGIVESLRRVWPEKSLGRVEELSRYVLREGAHYEAAVGQPDVAFQVFVQTVSERLAEDREEWWRLVRLAAWHVWNNGEASVKGAILGRLVRGLEFLETLVVHQDEVLAPQFETLAAIALHNVDLQQGGQNEMLETERARITEQAHRLFEDLWTVPEEGEEDGNKPA